MRRQKCFRFRTFYHGLSKLSDCRSDGKVIKNLNLKSVNQISVGNRTALRFEMFKLSQSEVFCKWEVEKHFALTSRVVCVLFDLG